MLVTPDTTGLKTRARGIARDLKAEDTLDAPPTRATMLAAGLTEVRPGAEPLTRELAAGETALLFLEGPEGKLTAVSLRVVRADKGSWQVAYVQSADGSKFWGRTGLVPEGQDMRVPLYPDNSTSPSPTSRPKTASSSPPLQRQTGTNHDGLP